MRVLRVDHALCCGSGMCAALAPDYFALDNTGRVVVRQQRVLDADADVVANAVLCCPTEAIEVAES